MNLIKQIILSFTVIFILILLGLTLNHKRLTLIVNSHHQIKEEWNELDRVHNWQHTIDNILYALALKDQSKLPLIPKKMAIMAQELQAIQIIHPFEEIGHGEAEDQLLKKLHTAFNSFSLKFNQFALLPVPHQNQIRQRLISQLTYVKALTNQLQDEHTQTMGQSITYAEGARQELVRQSIIYSLMIVIFVILASLWFILYLKRRAEETIKHEKTLTIALIAKSLAHEIRNPLSIIKSSADIVKKKTPSTSEEHELLGYLIDEVQRIDDLMEQLLNLGEQRTTTCHEEDIGAIINYAIILMKGKLKEKHIEFKYDNQCPGTHCCVNKNQIIQVIVNLLLNAIQASEVGGKINLVTCLEEHHYHIMLRDEGKGVGPADTKKIFDPFYSTKNKGAGLGLSVVKKIIEEHHGQITVNSILAQGTTFRVILPHHDKRS